MQASETKEAAAIAADQAGEAAIVRDLLHAAELAEAVLARAGWRDDGPDPEARALAALRKAISKVRLDTMISTKLGRETVRQELFTSAQTAVILGLTSIAREPLLTVRRMARRGELEARRVSRWTMITRRSIERLVTARPPAWMRSTNEVDSPIDPRPRRPGVSVSER